MRSRSELPENVADGGATGGETSKAAAKCIKKQQGCWQMRRQPCCFLRVFLNLHVLDGAALHGQQVVLLIDFAPIHHLPDAGFQHVVSYDLEPQFLYYKWKRRKIGEENAK